MDPVYRNGLAPFLFYRNGLAPFLFYDTLTGEKGDGLYVVSKSSTFKIATHLGGSMKGRGLILKGLSTDDEFVQPPLKSPVAAIEQDGAVHLLTVGMGKTPDHGSIHEAARGATPAPRRWTVFCARNA